MHWAVILTMLALSLSDAWLVFVEGWTAIQAAVTVSVAVGGTAVALMIVVLAIAPKQHRAGLLQIMRDTVKQDLRDILRWIRID
jgi:hypothetical protein